MISDDGKDVEEDASEIYDDRKKLQAFKPRKSTSAPATEVDEGFFKLNEMEEWVQEEERRIDHLPRKQADIDSDMEFADLEEEIESTDEVSCV